MTKSTVGRAAAFAVLSLATITLILTLPSGGELVAASPTSGTNVPTQTGSTPAPKIAVIDTERIVATSKAGRAVQSALDLR